MRFSPLRKVIVKDGSGSSVWKETTEIYMPKGGAGLSFKQTALFVIGLGIGLFAYAQIKTEFNPDSQWAKVYKQMTENPLGYFQKTAIVDLKETKVSDV